MRAGRWRNFRHQLPLKRAASGFLEHPKPDLHNTHGGEDRASDHCEVRGNQGKNGVNQDEKASLFCAAGRA